MEKASELCGRDAMGLTFCLDEKSWTYQDMGCFDLAMATSERSIAIGPGNSKAHHQLAIIYHNLGLNEATELSYQKALALDEKYAIAQNNLGCLFRELERWQEAIACFERALEINPKYSLSYRNRALLHLLRRERRAAEKDIRSALQVNPYDASVKLYLGVHQALSGDLITAQATWRDGLILYPEHDLRSRLYRTIYTVALGQPEQGLAELQTILQQERPPAGLLREVLQIARLLQRCPEPLPGLAEAVRLLDWGRGNAPVFELKPPPSA
ncbi:MAG: tetratricopeptide repeat protein [Cyanobium sp.]